MSYWYGFDVAGLPAERRISLAANLPRCKAQTRILNGKYDPYNEDQVFSLWMAAFGDEEAARKARLDSQWLVVRRDTAAVDERMKAC